MAQYNVLTYSGEYARNYVWRLWFVLLRCPLEWVNFPIYFRVALLALGQSYDCPSPSGITMNDLDNESTMSLITMICRYPDEVKSNTVPIWWNQLYSTWFMITVMICFVIYWLISVTLSGAAWYIEPFSSVFFSLGHVIRLWHTLLVLCQGI